MTVSAYTLQWPDPIPRWTGERRMNGTVERVTPKENEDACS